MITSRVYFLLIVVICFFESCSQKPINFTPFISYKTISNANYELTEVMLDNIFPPTVAARNYAYSNIAAYEVFALLDSNLTSLNNHLKDLNINIDKSKFPNANKYLASILAFYLIANHVTFPEGSFIPYIDTFLTLAKSNHFPSITIDDSKNLAKAYTDKLINEWTSKDNYAETRSASKYALPKDESKWLPTPPGYFQAVEPHWNEIRPLCISAADEFIVVRPPKYSSNWIKNRKGVFAKQTYDVYESSKKLTDEQKYIADFWDCNPYAIQVVGHVNFSIKKISPGGHWMSIASIASKTAKAKYEISLIAHTMVSIALFDAFISCWDEKYRSNLVRPETVINRYIDRNWRPYLQTPPFPSYTSGHSCISTASAIMLTNIFGKNFTYTDNSELEFGIPNRSFKSFLHASQEAAISRFYGGIHYMFDVDEGIIHGKLVAKTIEKQLKDILNQNILTANVKQKK